MSGSNGSSGPGGTTRRGSGRRALFSEAAGGPGRSAPRRPVTKEREGIESGRRAVFSSTAGPAGSARAGSAGAGPTSAVIHCRTCLKATPVSLTGLAVSLTPSIWLPTRPWSHLMRCPACGRASWCRIDWPWPAGKRPQP